MGHLVGQLSAQFEAYGMDLNHWAVNKSKEAAEKASLQTASAQELPFKNSAFNVVIIKHIVEHLPEPKKAIDEIGRVTEPGGILILATPNLGSLLKPWKGEKWIGYQDPTHISLKPPEEWLKMIEDAGFDFIRVFSDGFWDVPYIRFVPKQIQKLFFGSLGGFHLVRELICAIEANGYSWALNIKNLLLETCKKVSKRKKKKLTPREYAHLQKRYRNILTRGESELPAIPPKPNGRRGKMAKSDAHNLWERLKEHESACCLPKNHQYPLPTTAPNGI